MNSWFLVSMCVLCYMYIEVVLDRYSGIVRVFRWWGRGCLFVCIRLLGKYISFIR